MEDLTARQRQVYNFVRTYAEREGYPPTLQEIARYLGVKGNLGVLRHLRALEKKSYLSRAAGSSRGIVLPRRTAAVRLPLLGQVQAGPLSEALEQCEGELLVDPALVSGEESFALRVQGDSMIEAQIVPGDLAIIRSQSTAENGDIVVAMLDGEATLKRFFHEGKKIRLQPENSRLQPIILQAGSGEMRILGKLTGIVRSLE